MATSLEKSKKLNGVIEPFHLSTNPEILVKIGPLASEPVGLRGRPLKNLKNKEKTSVKYIALPATLPSGLNYYLELYGIRVRNAHVLVVGDNTPGSILNSVVNAKMSLV